MKPTSPVNIAAFANPLEEASPPTPTSTELHTGNETSQSVRAKADATTTPKSARARLLDAYSHTALSRL